MRFGIEQANLVDALARLRPTLFGPIARGTTPPGEHPVFVNNVRVEGFASLRELTASHVEEVRYWKREEAAMKFGRPGTPPAGQAGASPPDYGMGAGDGGAGVGRLGIALRYS